MRLFKRTVEPTLFLSAAGVLVETLEHHAFAPGGQKPGPNLEQVDPPNGAAVVAVQFVHLIGQRFVQLQCFQLSYYHRAPGRDLMEEFLATPFDRLQLAATPTDTTVLAPGQRQVLMQLLKGSDPKAWDASQDVQAALGSS